MGNYEMTYVRPYAEVGARVLLATMFILSGISKLGSFAGTQAYMESTGVPGLLLPLVILLEVGAGLAIVVGLLTRFSALALAAFTLIAAVLFHADFANQMQMLLFMKNLTITGGLLLLAAYGGGSWTVDNLLARRRQAA